MDKYEYSLKLEEITRLAEEGEYEEAVKLVDTVDWRRVRNVRTLCMVSEIYEETGRLEDSKEILLRAYKRSQIGRNILFRLTEVAIKMGEFDDAVEYYSEFVNAAPNDTARYVLKYKIYKGRGSSLADQIAILEEYRDDEFTEKWTYELAKLYKKNGQMDKCIDTCDDLVLWFRQGKYVVKALELKKTLAPLTPIQQTLYDNRDEFMEEPKVDMDEKLPEMEKVILETLPSSQEEAITDNIITNTEKELAQAVTQHTEENQNMPEQPAEETDSMGSTRIMDVGAPVLKMAQEEALKAAKTQVINTKEVAEAAKTQIFDTKKVEAAAQMLQNAVNIPQTNFNTMDLQKELAESMRDIVAGITPKQSEEDIIEPNNDIASMVEPKEPELPVEEEEIEGQLSIDDILTAMGTGQEPAQETAATAEAVKEELPEIEPEVKEELPVTEQEVKEEPSVAEPEVKTAPEPQPVPTYQNSQPVPPQLTTEQKYLFSYFSSVTGLREQIAAALTAANEKIVKDKTSKSGNIVITGLPGSGKTTLAIAFAKAISAAKGEKTARIAKIYAEDFNKKDIPSTIAKIAGGILIIEEAGDLADPVVDQLSKAMEFRTDGLLIILEDEKKLLKDLFKKHPGFADKFTSEVPIPVFTNDELVSFGKTYASDEDYKIDDMATLALYNRIGELQSPDHPVVVLDVKDIVDGAIKRASGFGPGKMFKLLSKKRYDEEDRIILYEKDFKK